MNRQETAKLLAVMFAACPTQATKISERDRLTMLDAYTSLLDDVSYEHGNAALRVLLQTRTWLPSVAEIRTTAIELSRGHVLPGGEAWGAVVKAIGKHGGYKQPGADFTFADSTTARVVLAMDWRLLCSSTNATADRARFVELYDKLASQSQREAVSPQLAEARAVRELPAPPQPPDPDPDRSDMWREIGFVPADASRTREPARITDSVELAAERDRPEVQRMVAELVEALS